MSKIGIDAGLTFCKVAELSNDEIEPCSFEDQQTRPFYSEELGGTLKFRKIPSGTFIDTLSEFDDADNIVCTGGNHSSERNLSENGENIFDELECLIDGVRFYNRSTDGFYTLKEIDQYVSIKPDLDEPFIIVNVGTGISVIYVDECSFSRIGGSCIGGGTFDGILKSICDIDAQDAIKNAKRGDSNNVDKLVGDIYPNGYCNLSKDVLAASFAKYSKESKEEDAIKSLLKMISSHSAQIAYLYATIKKVKTVIFLGNFLQKNEIACQHISKSFHYWSDNNISPIFAEHSGFLGAVGALIKSLAYR